MNKLSRILKKLGEKTISHQKTALAADFGNNSGSEFPDVTEQTSFVSEVLGRAPSGSFRSIISALASTFISDGLSTSIISPTDSSATLLFNYHSISKSANLSTHSINSGLILSLSNVSRENSIKKALITEGSFGSVENSFIEETLSTKINNIIPQMHELRRQTAARASSLSQILTPAVNGFIKLTKKSLIISLAVWTVIISSGIYILFFQPKQASAAWFNENWAYRQTVAITNSGSNQTDYQAKITLDTATLITAGKVQSDCDDIRLTDTNGKLLPHWIETGTNACNTATTAIWAKVPSITTSGATVYLYYGNPSAPSTSSGQKVFEFFDDFGTTPVGNAQWTTTGSPTVSSGELSLSNSAGVVSNSTVSTNDGAKALGFRAKTASTTVNTARLGYSNTNTLATAYYNDDAANIVLGPENTYLTATGGSDYIGHYTFDTLSSLSNGDAVVDASGNNNDLTSVNGGTIISSSIRGKGVTFNGSTQYIKQKAYATQANFAVVSASSTNLVISGDASAYGTASGTRAYMVATTGTGGGGWGFLGACTYSDPNTTCLIYTAKSGGSNAWNISTPTGSSFTYDIRKSNFHVTGDRTVGIWAKTGGAAQNQTVIVGGFNFTVCSSLGYNITINSSNVVTLTNCGGDVGSYSADTNWHFYVGTKSGSTLTLYVDGASSASGAANGVWGDSPVANIPFGVGISFSGTAGQDALYRYFNGSVDSPFVLDSALTAAQVKALYHASGSKYGVMTDNGAANFLKESSTDIDASTYHIFEITEKNGSSSLTIDGGSANTSSTNPPDSAQYIRFENSDASNTVSVDWVYVRKTASTQPSIASPASEEQGKGPIAYWKFDDGQGSTTQDSTSSNYDGTITGATWQTEDKCIAGKCLFLTSATDRVSAGASNNLNITSGDATYQTWVKLTAPTFLDGSTNWTLFSNESYQASGMIIRIDGETGKLMYRSNQASASTNFTTTSAPITSNNTWYHITAVKSGTTVTFYVNGKLIQSGTITNPVTTANAFTIGSAVGGSQSVRGFMDEAKVYNFARTSAQILADYQSGLSNASTKQGTSAILGSKTEKWLSDGLVGYWKMDDSGVDAEGETSTDSSGNANTGTLYGDNSVGDNGTGLDCTATGKYGTGCSLDGTDDYVSVTDSSSLSPTAQLTLSAWINPSAIGTINYVIAGKWDYGANKRSYQLYLDTSSKVIFALSSDGTGNSGSYATRQSSSTLSTSTWYHVVGKFNPTSGNLDIFINGSLDNGTLTNTIPSSIYDSDRPFLISGQENNGSTLSYFNGKIDDVRVYNRALSPKEVSDLYNWAPGPVGYWAMEDKVAGDSQTIVDTSGSGNNGTTIDGANNTGMNCKANGKYGSGCSFDGTDDYITVTGGTTFQPKALTFSMWVKPSSAIVSGSSQTDLIDYRGASGSDRYGYILSFSSNAASNDGKLHLVVGKGTGGGGWNVYESTTASWNANTWYHVAVTHDGSDYTFYVNGVKETSAAASAFAYGSMNTNLGIAAVSTGGEYFPGVIDDVKIYNYARTAKQVVQDMNAGHPAVGSPVGSAVGYWKFDEGADNTCSGGTNDVCNSGSQGSTLDGAASSFSSPATATSGWSQNGKYGKALNYDDTGDLVAVSNASGFFQNQSFSVSAWVLFNSTANGDMGIMEIGNAGTDTKLHLIKRNNKLLMGFYSDDLTGTATFSASTWYHVTFTWDASTKKRYIYINGKVDAEGTSTGALNVAAGTTLNIGTYGSGRLNGRIDEMKLYNYVLTADEVKLDYNRSSSMVLGSLSDNSSYQSNAANQEYCIPGDTSTCTAPVGRWDFEEGSGGTAYDKSGNAYNGTWSGTGTRYTTGKAGKGAIFNGTDDYISVGNINKTLNTFSAWFKPSSAITASSGGLATVATFVDGAGHNADIWIHLGNSTGVCTNEVITIMDTLNNKRTCVTDITIPAGWNHLEVVWNSGSSRYDIYLNGSLQTVTAGTSTHVGQITVSNLEFAYKQSTPEFSDSYANYTLDKAMIFTYARSAAQVAWDYNRGKPVGWWKFDECQGTTLNDSSGNSNNGTITIGATGEDTVGTCTTSSTAWGTGATGKRNSSLSFDGTDDYAGFGDIFDSQFAGADKKFSISVWVKPAATMTNHLIVAKSGDSSCSLNQREYILNLYTNSKPQFFWTNLAGTAYRGVSGSTSVTDTSQWYHITAVYDGSVDTNDGQDRVTMYVNGKSESTTVSLTSGTLANSDIQDGTAHLGIGKNLNASGANCGTAANYFNGQIDDVRIFNYTLTPTQVREIMNDGAVRFGPSTGSP